MRRIALARISRAFAGPAAATLLWAVPGLAAAETLTVTGISIPGGDTGYALSVPTVEIVDGNLTEEQVRALFAPTSGEAFAGLATLNAKKLSIPEITLTYTLPDAGGSSTLTYRDFELNDVVDGVAASTQLGGSQTSAPNGFSADIGRMSTGRFDLAGLIGFYGIGPAASSDEIRPIYSDFRFEGGSFTAPGFNCTLGAATAAEFSARPLRSSLVEISAVGQELQDAEASGMDASPEAVSKLIAFYVDILTAMRSSPVAFDGFSCAGADESGDTLTTAMKAINIGGFEPGIYPPISADGFTFDMDKLGAVTFDNFTFKKIDFAGPLALLAEVPAGQFNEAWFVTNARKLIPAFDGLSLAGLKVDVAESEEAERVRFGIGDFDLTLDNYVNGVPADFSVSAEAVTFPVPTDMKDGPATELLKRGITELSLDFGTALRWDNAARAIVIDQVLVDSPALGRVLVSGTLGNARETLFSEDVALATVAAQQLTLKDLRIEIVDRGFGQIVVEAGAAEAKQSVPAFRTTIGGMLQGMTLAILGNSDEALLAARALGNFIAGAPEMALTLTAVDPNGLSLADFSAAEQDPTSLAGKLRIVAESSGTPVAAPPVLPDASPQAPAESEQPAAPSSDTETVQQEKLRLKAPPRPQ